MKVGLELQAETQPRDDFLSKQIARLRTDEEFFWMVSTNCRAVVQLSGKSLSKMAKSTHHPSCNISSLFNFRSRVHLSRVILTAFVDYYDVRKPEALFEGFLTLEQVRNICHLPPPKH